MTWVLSNTYEVGAPPEVVWHRIDDYQRRLEWDVFVRRIEVHGGGAIQVGSELTQYARWRSGGVRMRVRYTRHEPLRAATVDMVQGPWFMRRFVAEFELEAGGAGTRVRSQYRIDWRWAWLVAPIAGRIFTRETHARWASLVALCEHAAAR